MPGPHDPVLAILDAIEPRDGDDGRRVTDRLLRALGGIAGAAAGAIYVMRGTGEERRPERRGTFGAAPPPPGIEPGSAAARALVERRPVAEGAVLALPLIDHAGRLVGAATLVADAGTPFAAGLAERFAPVVRVVGGAVERAEMIDRITRQNAELLERNRELAEQRARVAALQAETEQAFETSVALLARAAELHDEDTGNHILRLDAYAEALARHMRLPEAFCAEIGFSAALHDVGKMSVDSAILKKRGRLTAAERVEMERHTVYGYEILRRSERLRMAAEIAWCHHEKWDGSGYPRGLAGEDIPLAARIVALADVYDALRQPRVYKTGMPHDAVCAILLQGGEGIDPVRHFDPAVRAAFAAHHADFDEIYGRLADLRAVETAC